MKKSVYTNLLLFITPILLIASFFSPSQKAMGAPDELITKINAYRSENGVHQLVYNPILMQTAQDQADYMAATRTVSHYGPNNSRPMDRAAAAGYGDGWAIFGSEIIYGGWQASPDIAIAWWKQSPNHNPWMLSPNYAHIGAGIAYAGDYVYLAVVMAYTVDGYPRNTFTPTPGQALPTNTPTPTLVPTATNTPDPDQPTTVNSPTPTYSHQPTNTPKPSELPGTKYIVKAGDYLSKIASYYSIPWFSLATYNSLYSPYTLEIGQVIYIPPGYTANSTPTQKPVQPTKTPFSGSTPTKTIYPSATQINLNGLDWFDYKVQSSDFLASIATKFGVGWQDIAAFNGLQYPWVIYPGQFLKIPGSKASIPALIPSLTPTPPPSTPTDSPTDYIQTSTPTMNPELLQTVLVKVEELSYTIQSGDYFKKIADTFDFGVEDLAVYNQLNFPYIVCPGQVILIPVYVEKELLISPTPILKLESTITQSPVSIPAGDSTVLFMVNYTDHLAAIGHGFGIDWRWLAVVNELSPPYIVYAGQVLIINPGQE